MALGDGAALYLQMMKTFMIMFLLLSIINIPIFLIYENSTEGNSLASFDFWKYFTLGNLGQLSNKCGWSDMKSEFNPNEAK